LPPQEKKLLEAFKLRYNMYKPMNYYSLNQSDPNFDVIFREQLFRNNTNFFKYPDDMQNEIDKLA